jgi:hypothetical protein
MTAPKFEVEFAAVPARRVRVAELSDAALERAARRLKLWTPGEPFPTFTFYENGLEVGGGGDL